jgi:hypothetical protein
MMATGGEATAVLVTVADIPMARRHINLNLEADRCGSGLRKLKTRRFRRSTSLVICKWTIQTVYLRTLRR